jgi:hypothetical protein
VRQAAFRWPAAPRTRRPLLKDRRRLGTQRDLRIPWHKPAQTVRELIAIRSRRAFALHTEPDARQVGLALARFGRRSREVGFAIRGSWQSGSRVVYPLPRAQLAIRQTPANTVKYIGFIQGPPSSKSPSALCRAPFSAPGFWPVYTPRNLPVLGHFGSGPGICVYLCSSAGSFDFARR